MQDEPDGWMKHVEILRMPVEITAQGGSVVRIVVRATKGVHLYDCMREVVALGMKYNCPVQLQFNDRTYAVPKPNDLISKILDGQHVPVTPQTFYEPQR